MNKNEKIFLAKSITFIVGLFVLLFGVPLYFGWGVIDPKQIKKWNSECVVTGLYVTYREDHHTTYEYKYAQVQDSFGFLYDIPKTKLNNARMHDTIMVYFSQYKKENILIDSAFNLTIK